MTLPRRLPAEVTAAAGTPLDAETLAVAARLVEDVQRRGDAAARQHGEAFGELVDG